MEQARAGRVEWTAFNRTPAKEPPMLEWILILLVIAAVAGLLGLNAISGVALTGAKVLIGIVLVIFLLMLLGVWAL
jgi:uncharacterized membrane protein YtjA (UPF0391 family)